MENALITVVIPVYRVEKYIECCVKSVVEQTYKNLEILLIDDGSPDLCPEICERLAKEDSRIRVYHKKNGGLSDARNFGIEKASGEYITFVDSDDYIEKDFILYLYTLLAEKKADISMCNYKKFSEEAGSIDTLNEEIVETFPGTEGVRRFCYQKIHQEAWGKLYKRALFEHVRFPVGKLYEDYGTTYKVFFLCNKIVRGEKEKYFYRVRTGSIMNSAFSMKDMDRADLTEEFLAFIHDHCPDLSKASYTRALISYAMLLRDCPGTEEYKACYHRISFKIRECRKQVLHDANSPFVVKLIAVTSVISMNLTKILGKIMKCVKK